MEQETVQGCRGSDRKSSQSPLFCAECSLGGRTFYSALTQKAPQEVTAMRGLRRDLGAGQTILREGEVPTHVYTLYSGWAYRFKLLPNGGRHILEFYIPGDFIYTRGVADEPMRTTVKALTNVHLCGFSRANLASKVANDPVLQTGMAGELRLRMGDQDDSVIDLARRPAEARLLRLLLRLCRRMSERELDAGGRFEMPLPQAVLADALGVTPVYLNRMLVSLRERGVLNMARRRIVIDDIARLQVELDRADAA